MKNKGVMISLAAVMVIGILITKSTYRFVERSDASGGEIRQEESEEPRQEAGIVTYGLGDPSGQPQPFSMIDGAEAGQAADYGEEGLLERTAGQEDMDTAEGGGSPARIREPESISPLDTKAAAEMMMDGGEASEEGALSYYKKRLQDLDSQIEKNRESQSAPGLNNSAKSAASGELKLWDSELNAIYNEILERLDKESSGLLVEEQRAWLKERDSLAMEAARNSVGGSRESVEYTVSLAGSTRQRAYELVETYADVLSD